MSGTKAKKEKKNYGKWFRFSEINWETFKSRLIIMEKVTLIVTCIILFFTMIEIRRQASATAESVELQHTFNSTSLRPYLAADPSFKQPFVSDSFVVITTSIMNYGKTPALNVRFVGRPTMSSSFPCDLLRSFVDSSNVTAIVYPGQADLSAPHQSILREATTRLPILGCTIDSLYRNEIPLYFHFYAEYATPWGAVDTLKVTYEYDYTGLWHILAASLKCSDLSELNEN